MIQQKAGYSTGKIRCEGGRWSCLVVGAGPGKTDEVGKGEGCEKDEGESGETQDAWDSEVAEEVLEVVEAVEENERYLVVRCGMEGEVKSERDSMIARDEVRRCLGGLSVTCGVVAFGQARFSDSGSISCFLILAAFAWMDKSLRWEISVFVSRDDLMSFSECASGLDLFGQLFCLHCFT